MWRIGKKHKHGYHSAEDAHNAREYFIETGEIIEPPDNTRSNPCGYTGVSQSGNYYSWAYDKNRKQKSGYHSAEDAHNARKYFINTGEIIEPPRNRKSKDSEFPGIRKDGNHWQWRYAKDKIITSRSGYRTDNDAHNAREHFINTGEIIEPPSKNPPQTGYQYVYKFTKSYGWRDPETSKTKSGYLSADDAHAARQLYLETGEIIEP
jgi:hypothetical protein